jgi:hypothetical protein
MTSKSNRLKNHLRESDDDPLSAYLDRAEKEADLQEPPKRGLLKNLIIVSLVVLFGFFAFRGTSTDSLSPVAIITSMAGQSGPSEDLLTRMNSRMVEMGYTGLDHDNLRALRSDGVTATYISNVRALGYTDLTLDEAVILAKANASSAFIAMMIELGYDLDVHEIANLRNAGVTAHYTSNIHDLGYRDITPEQLIRMRRIGVTPNLIRELQAEMGEDVPIEDIIRHRISNQ